MSPKQPKKPNPQPKRIQVTDTSGWTHIIKGSKSQRNQLHIQPMAHLQPKEMDPELTAERLDELLRKFTREWEESDCWGKILTMLEEQVMKSENVNITSCVCLGLGSLAGIDAAKASWYELVALISILDTLKEKHKVEHVYFQDPTFNDMDKTFLAKLGYTVLERPDASNKMNENTFLFAPHLEYQHIATALAIAHPSLYMGSALEFWVETADTDEVASMASKELFQAYLKTHTSYCMPRFDGDHWWRYMGICWTPATGRAVEPMVGMIRWSAYHRSLPRN